MLMFTRTSTAIEPKTMISLNNTSHSTRTNEGRDDYALAPYAPLAPARPLRSTLRVNVDLANAAAFFLSQARRSATAATTTTLIAQTSHTPRAPLRLPESAHAHVAKDVHPHRDRLRHTASEAEDGPPSPSKSVERRSKLHIPHPFSLSGVPVLEERVPHESLPDELLVYDRANATGRHTHRRRGAGRPEKALRYVRLYPCPDRSGAHVHAGQSSHTETGNTGDRNASGSSASLGRARSRGYLFLDPENEVADGRRSLVYRAPLVAALGRQRADHKGKAREEEEAEGHPRRVAVVAKMAKGDCRSHYLLRQEGKAYAELPPHLFGPTEVHHRASTSARVGTEKDAQRVVPNFYGFYVPVDSKGRRLDCRARHTACDGYLQAGCAVDWPSPILLMEDCGMPVELQGMKKAERSAIYLTFPYSACG